MHIEYQYMAAKQAMHEQQQKARRQRLIKAIRAKRKAERAKPAAGKARPHGRPELTPAGR